VVALVAAAALLVPLPGLRSPSGNITCFVSGGVLHCAIAHADYSATLQRRCFTRASVEWHGFELAARGAGRVTCSGGILYDPDTERPRYVTLAYGASRRLGVFACTSRITGVTCTSPAGHGLFVSRESWRAW